MASWTPPLGFAPGVADPEFEQCHGHTPALLASVDAIQLHGMLGAAIQVCPVPEDQAGVLQRSDSCSVLFLFFASSPRVRTRGISSGGHLGCFDCQSPSAYVLNFSGWALR